MSYVIRQLMVPAFGIGTLTIHSSAKLECHAVGTVHDNPYRHSIQTHTGYDNPYRHSIQTHTEHDNLRCKSNEYTNTIQDMTIHAITHTVYRTFHIVTANKHRADWSIVMWSATHTSCTCTRSHNYSFYHEHDELS